MKALVGAFNQEKALVGVFSVITNLCVIFVSISSVYICLEVSAFILSNGSGLARVASRTVRPRGDLVPFTLHIQLYIGVTANPHPIIVY